MTPTEALEQTLSPAELDRARLYLDQTQDEIRGVLRNVPDAQWGFKPACGGWSIAENAEHIAIVLERILGPMRAMLDQSPVQPPNPDRESIDDIIIYRFPSRLEKFRSPIECGGGISREDAERRVAANYARLREWLDTAPDLRDHTIESAPLKAVSKGVYDRMDGYQWILVAAAHTERHTKQILEVMANAGSPA